MSLSSRFNTLHPSGQYSSIYASDVVDPLIERGDQLPEGFAQADGRGHVNGLNPAGEIRDRFDVEGPVFMVDHAVVDAGDLNDPRDATRTL